MGEPRREPSFAQEPSAQLLVTGQILCQALERHPAIELDVAREVDDRHRAVAERALDLVPSCDERAAHSSP